MAGRPRPCGKTEFTCSNQHCIPVQLQCDLFSDCGDGGSDEQDCKAHKSGTSWVNRSRESSEEMKHAKCHQWCHQEVKQCSLFKWDVVLFMVMHCMYAHVWRVLYERRRCPLCFCTSNETHSRYLRSRGTVPSKSCLYLQLPVETYVKRKQIHVERMRFATKQMLMLSANANLDLRGTNRQANVKVIYDQLYSFSPPIRTCNDTAIVNIFNWIVGRTIYFP